MLQLLRPSPTNLRIIIVMQCNCANLRKAGNGQDKDSELKKIARTENNVDH